MGYLKGVFVYVEGVIELCIFVFGSACHEIASKILELIDASHK